MLEVAPLMVNSWWAVISPHRAK